MSLIIVVTILVIAVVIAVILFVRVNSLSSSVAVKTTTVPVTFQVCAFGTPPTCTNCVATQFTFVTMGNLVYLHFPQTNLDTCQQAAPKNYINIQSQLPASLLPPTEMFFPIIMYYGAGTQIAFFNIKPDGTMQIANQGGNPLGNFNGTATDAFNIWANIYSWIRT